MGEFTKQRFDALTSLRDHAWAEFGDKARAEWRLSFGVWAAILASAGAILSANGLNGSPQLTISCAVAVIIIAVVHLRFLLWIQSRLNCARTFLREAQDEMRKLAHLPAKDDPGRPSGWKQPSLQVQFAITVVVGCVLVIVVYSLPPG